MSATYDTRRAKVVIEIAATFFDVPADGIYSKRRNARNEQARFAAYYLLREEMGLSYPQIAHAVGRHDHTSAWSGVHRCKALMTTEPGYLRRLRAAWEATKGIPDHAERVGTIISGKWRAP